MLEEQVVLSSNKFKIQYINGAKCILILSDYYI